MIVVDSSAVVAIWKKEPLAQALEARLAEESEAGRRMSVAVYLEAGTALAATMPNQPQEAVRRFERWVAETSIELAPIDEEQIHLALDARIRYGRGFGHPAKLNFGDCFSYALAKILRAPLLYTGDDFAKTDIRSALAKRTRKK